MFHMGVELGAWAEGSSPGVEAQDPSHHHYRRRHLDRVLGVGRVLLLTGLSGVSA